MDRKSTGLKDINGKKIFVGDTVFFETGDVGYIKTEDDKVETLKFKEKGIVKEDMYNDCYVVTDDGFAFRLDKDKIQFFGVEKRVVSKIEITIKNNEVLNE